MLEITEKLQEQFDKISASGKLYKSQITGTEVWDLYLKSMNEEHNRPFRDPESSFYNCNYCCAFIRRYGNVVAIDADFNVVSLFDVIIGEEYSATTKKLSELVKSKPIAGIFLESYTHLSKLRKINKKAALYTLGTIDNIKRYTKEEANKFKVVTEGQIVTFDHMALTVPACFVNLTSRSVESISGDYRAAREVFQRCMEEISLDTLELVRDLITQGSLLDGTTHVTKVTKTIEKKRQYDAVSPELRENWTWVASRDYPYAKFKNELIGVLCSELSLGEEINKACENWNKRVDPANYMRAKAPITKAQIKLAETFVVDNGYEESFDRRLASVSDIKVTEIRHINNTKKSTKAALFGKVAATKASRHSRNKFDKVEEVTIDKFMEEILPTSTSVALYLTSQHLNNTVAMTTTGKEDSKPIFKWDNNYSWTYKGNLAGHSQIKQAVKAAGGNVTGVLNARLAWNDDNQNDNSDLDIWAEEPDGTRIGHSAGFRADGSRNRRTPMTGQLDVDNMHPGGKIAVENITWTDLSKMKDGVYKIWINGYSIRSSQGFKAEIELEGETYAYEYKVPVKSGQNVKLATVKLEDGVLTVVDDLPSQHVSKDVCGLDSNEFHQVDLVCLSPNHWGANQVGNKHYFFMLGGAKFSEPLVGFHPENLNADLTKHRKVIEALSVTAMLEPEEKHLAGVGFNATVKNEVILKVKGAFERVLKVKF
tara:strand:- start:16149 stop:18278 length:2130 start_codon:yes stop_codon:yes gene_type:complete